MAEFNPEIQTENLAFDESELVKCGACGRLNPPSRPECLYCGGAIESSPAVKLELRALEAWEKGFNLIATGREGIDIDGISAMLHVEREFVSRVAGAADPLPIARVESPNAAETAAERLRALGLRTSVVSDAELNGGGPPLRLAGMEFAVGGIGLRAFVSGDVIRHDVDDLALIVVGSLSRSRVDEHERQTRADSRLTDVSTSFADEPVVDIYFRDSTSGFRIPYSGFDFSMLEQEKSYIGTENLNRLVDKLAALAPQTKIVSDYRSLRGVLGVVWPIEPKRQAHGLRRSGFGRPEFVSVSTTSNLEQFSKYSRLRRFFL
ncbi:MAG: hypothetical protein WKF34_04515 [Pyrinomonadaceae bacterium]